MTSQLSSYTWLSLSLSFSQTLIKNHHHYLHLLGVVRMGLQLNWRSAEAIATSLLDGNPIAIVVTAFIAFGLPVLLHIIFYRTVASPPSSNFLLLGPSGAGKTTLLSLVRFATLVLGGYLGLKDIMF